MDREVVSLLVVSVLDDSVLVVSVLDNSVLTFSVNDVVTVVAPVVIVVISPTSKLWQHSIS